MKYHHASIALLSFALTSCSESGPQPPAKGTPAFYWSAAQESFRAGDYAKTNDHLEKLTKGEFAAKAAPWRLILIDGLAHGYADMADKFETGARVNKANPAPFRRQASDFRSMSSRLALSFAETLQAFEKTNPAGDVTLDFPFPSGASTPVAAINRTQEGMLIGGPELETASKQALQRSVLLATARAVGAGDDTAKARDAFKAGPAAVPVGTFFRSMAQASLDRADVFSSIKLDQPDRYKFFCDHALELAKKLPEGKDTKDLTAKIQDAIKKAKKS